MRIAIVHYWWFKNRGGEAVIKNIIDLYPDADLFLHAGNDEIINKSIGQTHKGKIFKSFIQSLPFVEKFYKYYLPLMPIASESLDLTAYDLIISSEAGPAKGIISKPEAIHICYCHSPMRYIWDLSHVYQKHSGFFKRKIFAILSHYLRFCDVISANRVDYFIANSTFVSDRIMKTYRRRSKVIFPPVNLDCAKPVTEPDKFYLYVGELVEYKGIELAIQSFTATGRKLVVVGEGPLLKQLKKKVPETINFVGRVPNKRLRELYASCKALVFPGVEDFGIVPIEAMASGRPVIALRRGGAIDYIKDGENGLFFNCETVDSLTDALNRFEDSIDQFDQKFISTSVKGFSEGNFKKEFSFFIDEIVEKKRSDINEKGYL